MSHPRDSILLFLWIINRESHTIDEDVPINEGFDILH
jgi:hypothetical protein